MTKNVLITRTRFPRLRGHLPQDVRGDDARDARRAGGAHVHPEALHPRPAGRVVQGRQEPRRGGRTQQREGEHNRGIFEPFVTIRKHEDVRPTSS